MSDRLIVILPPVLSDEERIEKALSYSSLTEGDGSGYGDGWRYGDGWGDGWRYGYGYGYGQGNGGSSTDV
jgi:hypothetical protein